MQNQGFDGTDDSVANASSVKRSSMPSRRNSTGMSQLSLVEHALCPLDPRTSLVDNLVHDTKYTYSLGTERRTANARIYCPLGLSASDEVYLWGLLALSLRQPDPGPELTATPHWCLQRLGLIDQRSRRGGRQYQAFAQALRRLSVIAYVNDAFYDPLRAEHRRVSFRFLSYSLPEDQGSTRAWRIMWDPLFFELVRPAAGHFRFDFELYRGLDPASRRLFLFVSKVFSRRAQLRAIELKHLAVDLLGFSASLQLRDMKIKVRRCLQRLTQSDVFSDATIFSTPRGNHFVRLCRGAYFTQASSRSSRTTAKDSPAFDTLLTLGLDEANAASLIRRYPAPLVSEWTDITQAAQERFGKQFFRKSPIAYLIDNLSQAAKGNRTVPDWWQELRKAEMGRDELSGHAHALFHRIREELSQSQDGALQPDPHQADNPDFESLVAILSRQPRK